MAGQGKVQRVIDSYNGVPCTWIRPDDCPVRPGEPCGQIHQTCTSHKRSTHPDRAHTRGDPCGAHAMVGQLVCRRHGGAQATARANGARRVARERALGEVGQLIAEALDQTAAMSGVEQLTQAINYAGAMSTAYRWLLDELPVQSEWSYEEHTSDSGSVQRFVVVTEEGLVGPDAQGVQRLHAYEEGFRHWTALHGKLLKSAADIGLEERRQRFQEDQVASIGTAIRSIVAGLGRELDDPEVVPVVETALRAIAGPAG